MKCRFCQTELEYDFVDLAGAPPSNAFLDKAQLDEPELFFPLKLKVCHSCFLTQIDEYEKSEDIFSQQYIYFSSYSSSWLMHARNYVEMITERLSLNSESLVIEIASNDGYLLQFFKKKSIPCLGIEPAESTARVAIQKGIDVIGDFFGTQLAKRLSSEGRTADLIIGNNVLAHVPKLIDFVMGIRDVLKEDGVATLEFPHLMQLVDNCQFDTIYHEHFSYFSLLTVKKIFEFYGLKIFDVEELDTHGGSLRIYASRAEDTKWSISESINALLEKEISSGMDRIEYYMAFQEKVDTIKNDLLLFLIDQKKNGKTMGAYGAAAKGNTLLNYCGIKKDLIPYVVDASPHKQNKYLPGSHIPVLSESIIKQTRPDFILILPWNIKEEIIAQLSYIKEWGGRFVVAIPKLKIY